ncbi:hypothetical protein HKX48_005175 [Thoreauomyces humboldtii]|nr:hypothetical protein HKX48_005175 [Thoreauomyces humboldtii]
MSLATPPAAVGYFPTDNIPSESLPQVLATFVASHGHTTTFISPTTTTREQKAAFVRTLLEVVTAKKQQQKDEVVENALHCLRILSRETAGCQDLFLRAGMDAVLGKAGLDQTEKYKETPVRVEALKCLCNVVLQHPPARGSVRDAGGVKGVAKILKNDLSPVLIGEVMKTIYNLMGVHEGDRGTGSMTIAGVEVGTKWIKMFESILPEILYLLNTLPPTPLAPPLTHTLHTLLNFPLAPYRDLFLPPTDPGRLPLRLVTILDLSLVEAAGDLDARLPPLLIILAGICRADPRAKEAVRSECLPDDIDRSKPLDKGPSLTSRLIRAMTTVTAPNTRESVCDFLFVLCDERADNLVAYTGYGHAAGYLYAKGLLAPSASMPSAPSSSASGARVLPPIDPITGEHEREPRAGDPDDRWDGMTEDEKEEEAGRLMDLFDKLNRTGVIRAVVPGM